MEIIQKDNKILRQIAEEISVDDITSSEVKKLISDMKSTLSEVHDGAALAAPQVAVSKRLFIISDIAYMELSLSHPREVFEKKHYVFINPVIIKKSFDKKILEEGCLSVRPLYGKVRRSTKASIEAYDEEGNKFTMNGKGILAQIFQHEIDHLNGILFIDKAKNIRALPELM